VIFPRSRLYRLFGPEASLFLLVGLLGRSEGLPFLRCICRTTVCMQMLYLCACSLCLLPTPYRCMYVYPGVAVETEPIADPVFSGGRLGFEVGTGVAEYMIYLFAVVGRWGGRARRGREPVVVHSMVSRPLFFERDKGQSISNHLQSSSVTLLRRGEREGRERKAKGRRWPYPLEIRWMD